MLPLEGLRAIAVTLVFVQHYCMQFITYGHLSGLTLNIAIIGRNFGNCGVELFFVLSGFLIYGILLRRRPPFFDFMGRRLQRLYPAFLVSVVLGVIIDFWRPIPKIPGDFTNAVTYLAENLLFLPGLLPMDAVSAPNWSLSYEWWFYTTATLLFSVLGLASGSNLTLGTRGLRRR
jgi:peptidoglycan/LPS O-acetylase OafA/YrhL